MTDEIATTSGIAEQKSVIVKAIMNQEFYPTIVEENIQLDSYTKLPLSRLPALGVAFEPLAAAFQFILSGGEITSGICRINIPPGAQLAKFKDGAGH